MNKAGKPTVQDIMDLAAKCEKYYRERNARFVEDEKYYELDIKAELGLPDEFKEFGIVLPTGRDMVDNYCNHVDVSNARISVNRKATSSVADEHLEHLRKFYYGLVYMTNVMNSISPWRVGAKHHGLHGVAVYKHVWDADRWPDKPERDENESENDYAYRVDEWRAATHNSLPITIQAVNPHNVYPDPAYGGDLYVIEQHDKLVVDAVKKWPNWKNPDNKKITDTVKFVSYFDTKYRCDLVDGQPVLKFRGGVAPHSYRSTTYTIIDAGLGNIGIENKPEHRYVGIIRYIMQLLISESRNYSIGDTILAKTSWPWGYIKGADAKIASEVKPSFGKYVPLPAGVEIVDMYPQVPPEALNRHLERTAGYIAAHAAPRVSQGLSESGVRSSADRRLVLAEAGTRYQYSSEAFRHGAARVLMNAAYIYKNVIPGDIRVWAQTPTDEFDVEIKKDDIKEPFTCYVEFAPFSEEDEYRRQDGLIRLVAGGLANVKWARKQLSNMDPEAMEIEDEIQKLKNNPNLNAVTAQLALQMLQGAMARRGMAMDINAGNVTSEPQGGPGAPIEPGRSMTPPTPNMPRPGSADGLQNQLKAMRGGPMTATQGRGTGAGGNRM